MGQTNTGPNNSRAGEGVRDIWQQYGSTDNNSAGGPTMNRNNPSSPNGSPVYAGFWLRAVAYLIDYILIFFIAVVISFCILMVQSLQGGQGVNNNLEQIADAIGRVVSFIVFWLYFALQESSSKQATIGKRAMGLIVTDDHGKRLTFLRATGRHFAKIISALIFFVGFIMAGLTPKKQGLHDIIASTLVFKKTNP